MSADAPPTVPPLLMHVFPTFAVGGAQVRFAALANRFKARWRHVVVSLDGDCACAGLIQPDVPLTLLSPPGKGSGMLRNLWAIRALLRQHRPDVLVTGNWGSMDWVIANLVPPMARHLHMEDGFGVDEAAGQHRRRVLTRQLTLRGSTVVLPSLGLLRAAREEWHLPPGRLHYIPNGLDLLRFHPEGQAASLAIPGAGPVIGTVAALRPEKSIDRLLRACALLAAQGIAFRLVVVGNGTERERLEALAHTLGLQGRLLFAGHASNPSEIYRAFDIFALSSSTEQMPFSILEAMASGLAVVSTDVGDVRAMVASANQPFVTPLDDAAFASALGKLLGDAPLRDALGAANRARAVLDFGDEAMFSAYAALLDGPHGDAEAPKDGR